MDGLSGTRRVAARPGRINFRLGRAAERYTRSSDGDVRSRGVRPGPVLPDPDRLPALADVDRSVVEDERRLVFVVLGAGELQRHALPGVGRQVVCVLDVAG